MDPVSAGLGIVTAVLQLYTSLTAAYDLYISVADFPSTYRELRLGFLIERQRLELWGQKMLNDHRYEQENEKSQRDRPLWVVFEKVLKEMLSAFEGSTKTMEEYERHVGPAGKTRCLGQSCVVLSTDTR